jgi:hypothetical protein
MLQIATFDTETIHTLVVQIESCSLVSFVTVCFTEYRF